jgi:hypothetical protein
MGARQKATAGALIRARDIPAIKQWASRGRGSLRTLFSLTYEPDLTTQWRAIEAIGHAAKAIFEQNPEKVKDFARRLFWLMNDESGGIGWRAPETIGEIVYHVPRLADPTAIMLTGFLTEEPFERGTHAALARLGARHPSVIKSCAERLRLSLADRDPAIRAHAYRALNTTQLDVPDAVREKLSRDTETFDLYDFESGEMKTVTVGEYTKTLS